MLYKGYIMLYYGFKYEIDCFLKTLFFPRKLCYTIIKGYKNLPIYQVVMASWEILSYMRGMVVSKLFLFKSMIIISRFQQPKFYIKTKRNLSNYIPYSQRTSMHVII